MLITCPSCASEYTIEADRVGAAGRTVRCAACRTTWFAAAAAGPGAAAAVGEGAVACSEGAEPAAWRSEATLAAEPVAIAVEAQNDRAVAEPPASPPETPAISRRKTPRPGSANDQCASLLSGRAGLALALVLTLGVGLTTIVARAGIVRLWPEMAALYAAAGMPVNLRGLALNGVRSELQRTERETILVVEGEIANPTGRELGVPELALAVRDEGGEALYTWTNEAPRKTLGPGETARFRAKLASPPAEGRRVLVRFAAAGDGTPAATLDP